jgi:hypothetical protein
MERLANSVVPNLVQVLSALIQVKGYTILQYIDIALRLCHISTGENVFHLTTSWGQGTES